MLNNLIGNGIDGGKSGVFTGTFDGKVGSVTPNTGVFTTVEATIFDGPIGTGTATPAAGAFTTITGSGICSITDATDATSATAASLKTAGGIACVKDAWIGAALRVATTSYLEGNVGIGGAADGIYPLTVTDTAAQLVQLARTGTGSVAMHLSGVEWQFRSLSGITDVLFDDGLNVIVEGTSTLTGNVGIGAAASANADLLLEAGRLMLKESATPTADANYGKIYTKTDNKLYFQDGAGVEHPVCYSDYAQISFGGNSTSTTVQVQDIYTLLSVFDTDGPATISSADQANNRLTFGATRTYQGGFHVSAEVSAGGAELEFEAFGVADASSGTITGITEATPGVVTCSGGHTLSNGDRVKITGVVGMVEVNDQIFTVANVGGGDTTFELNAEGGANVNTSGYTSWSSGGTLHVAAAFVAIDEDFPNGTVGGASVTGLGSGTAGDHAELYVRNIDNANDVTVTEANLWASGV